MAVVLSLLLLLLSLGASNALPLLAPSAALTTPINNTAAVVSALITPLPTKGVPVVVAAAAASTTRTTKVTPTTKTTKTRTKTTTTKAATTAKVTTTKTSKTTKTTTSKASTTTTTITTTTTTSKASSLSRTTTTAPPFPTAHSPWSGWKVAPYAMTGSGTLNYSKLAYETGVKHFILAFILADGTSNPAWDGTMPITTGWNLAYISSLRAQGGDVCVSFGGAAGIELALVIRDAATLLAKYQAVVDRYALRCVDFDIEGSSIEDTASVNLRNQVIATLQANNPDLYVSYTLPVLPIGLVASGLKMLTSAKDNGVRVDTVNIMAMNYGYYYAPNGATGMGGYAIDAAKATYAQLQTLGLTSTTISVTPMLGRNDVAGETFTLNNTRELVNWAYETSWVEMLSYWCANRDKSSSSGISQSPNAFISAFAAFPATTMTSSATISSSALTTATSTIADTTTVTLSTPTDFASTSSAIASATFTSISSSITTSTDYTSLSSTSASVIVSTDSASTSSHILTSTPVTSSFPPTSSDWSSTTIFATSSSLFLTSSSSSSISISLLASSKTTKTTKTKTSTTRTKTTTTKTKTTTTKTKTTTTKVSSSSVARTTTSSSASPFPTAKSPWAGRKIAPYVLTSSGTLNYSKLAFETGVKKYILGFVLADRSGNPAWDGTMPITTSWNVAYITSLRAQGGDVCASFGGAGGTELALVVRDAPTLLAKYQAVVDRYALRCVDFDIEGSSISNTAAVNLRNQVIATLQANNPGLYVSYTLPVLTTGLVTTGLNLLSSAKAKGVRVDTVNIMAMDYGSFYAPNGATGMGGYAIDAAKATYAQLQTLGLTSTTISVTPMLGKNDVAGEIFTLANTQELVNWAKSTSWVEMLSYWCANRDNSASSGIPQSPNAFINAFKSFP